jgi:hypothetical protein
MARKLTAYEFGEDRTAATLETEVIVTVDCSCGQGRELNSLLLLDRLEADVTVRRVRDKLRCQWSDANARDLHLTRHQSSGSSRSSMRSCNLAFRRSRVMTLIKSPSPST